MTGGAPIGRRALLAGALGAATGLSSTEAQRPPPTPFRGDPDAPSWPSAERFALWPGTPPGAPNLLPRPDLTMNGPTGGRQLWVRGVAAPELHLFRPERPDGSAVLCLPGGGYGFLSVQNEGLCVARQLNASGMTVAVLTYRLPGEGWRPRALAPLHDARRAMRLLRARATALRIDPVRLGVLGFSAGGHLAADLAAAGTRDDYAPVDKVDAHSARPASAALIYPVTTLMPELGHSGSARNLLGSDATPEAAAARSPVLHIGADAPPMFVVHAYDDPIVPADHSLTLIAACGRARTPVMAFLLARGGHGFGVGRADQSSGRWPDDFRRWIGRGPATPSA